MKSKDPLWGVILAAGLGTRLRPLTQNIPKPLLPFAWQNPLSLAVNQLVRAGVEGICINTHYLAHNIENFVRELHTPIPIHVTYEPEILGTAGAYFPMLKWIKDHDVIVLNGDIVSNFPLEELIQYHQRENSFATMALLPHRHPNKDMPVWQENGRIISITHESPTSFASPHGFACIQILSKDFLQKIPPKGEVIPIYREWIKEGAKICSLIKDCFWFDLGTVDNYLKSQFAFLEGYWRQKEAFLLKLGMDSIPPNFLFIDKKTVIGNMTIHPPCLLTLPILSESSKMIGPFTVLYSDITNTPIQHLSSSIVMNKQLSTPHTEVRNAILGSGFEIFVDG